MDVKELRVVMTVGGGMRGGAREVVSEAKKAQAQIEKAQVASGDRVMKFWKRGWDARRKVEVDHTRNLERMQERGEKKRFALRMKHAEQEGKEQAKRILETARLEKRKRDDDHKKEMALFNEKARASAAARRKEEQQRRATDRAEKARERADLRGGSSAWNPGLGMVRRAAWRDAEARRAGVASRRAARDQYAAMAAPPGTASEWNPGLGFLRRQEFLSQQQEERMRPIRGAASFVTDKIGGGFKTIFGSAAAYGIAQIVGGVSKNRAYRASLAQLSGMNYGPGASLTAGSSYISQAALLGATPEQLSGARAALGSTVGDASGIAGATALAGQINSAGTLTPGRAGAMMSGLRGIGVGGKTGTQARRETQLELSKMFSVALLAGVKDVGRRADFVGSLLGAYGEARGYMTGGAGDVTSNVNRGVLTLARKGGSLQQRGALNAYQAIHQTIAGADEASKEAALFRMLTSGYGTPGSSVTYDEAEAIRKGGLVKTPGLLASIPKTLNQFRGGNLTSTALGNTLSRLFPSLKIGQAQDWAGVTGIAGAGMPSSLFSVSEAKKKVPTAVSKQLLGNVTIMRATEGLTDDLLDLQNRVRELAKEYLPQLVDVIKDIIGGKINRAEAPAATAARRAIEQSGGGGLKAVGAAVLAAEEASSNPFLRVALAESKRRSLAQQAMSKSNTEAQREAARMEELKQRKIVADEQEALIKSYGSRKDVGAVLRDIGIQLINVGSTVDKTPPSPARGGTK